MAKNFIGNYGKTYENAFEYARDRKAKNKPIGYDGPGTSGTINCSPCWDAWIEVVEKNKDAFICMTKDEIDQMFDFFDGGFQYGLVQGMSMAR